MLGTKLKKNVEKRVFYPKNKKKTFVNVTKKRYPLILLAIDVGPIY